ncbi:MAG TPA: hypothetical protein VGR89_16275 [Puia sp.]|nr:hypothetical protein [Puia sp.]
MKRKFLYALALLLCGSTVAFSKECARDWCGAAGKMHTLCNNQPKTSAAGVDESDQRQQSHIFLHTFIRILYI